MNNMKMESIVQKMTSFPKDEYQKIELLPEMLKLQDDLVREDLGEEYVGCAKIYDVKRHLFEKNEELGHVADAELMRFKKGCGELANLIKAEISGNKGENYAFKCFEYLRSQSVVLRNIEMKKGDKRTELDAIVITPFGITIVEVKNTSRDIYIDNEGNYYTTGEFLRLDCNIAYKMKFREELVREAIRESFYSDMPIQSVIVFTNNKIKVENKCKDLKTCFVSQLAYTIDSFKESGKVSEIVMDEIRRMIKTAECKESYPFEFDVKQFKKDFATVIVALEEKEEKNKDKKINEECRGWRKIVMMLKTSRVARVAAFICTIVISNLGGR